MEAMEGEGEMGGSNASQGYVARMRSKREKLGA